MLRLTLLSSRNGELAARVVDPGGQPFVLDFGDREVISGIRRQLQHGFTVSLDGQAHTVAAHADDMLTSLARYHAAAGLLVFFEEPTWTGRQGTEPRHDDLEDDETELLDVDDLPDVGHAMHTVYPPDELSPGAPTPVEPWARGAPSAWREQLPTVLRDAPDVGHHMQTVYPEDELTDEAKDAPDHVSDTIVPDDDD